MSGSDAFIGIGRGLGSIGQLTISNGASVTSTSAGRGAGGLGTLTVDGATLNLSGQHTGNFQSGAALVIGSGDGTGVATITNGSQVNITNLGTAGASFNVGGSSTFPLGTGALTIAGGSQVHVTAAPGLAFFQVGRDGIGTATIKEGSSVDVGDGSAYVGRFAGSTGTLLMQSGSTLNAGYIGIGRNPQGDGGTGLLVLDDSTITANTVEVGTLGAIAGNNGTINGNLVLHGLLAPGDSPGGIVVNGRINTGSGHLLLDVQDNGQGGFDVDHVLLTTGTTFDFTGLEVTFNFLGSTNPDAFNAASGFDLDNFLKTLDPATGDIEGLSTVFAPGQSYDSVFQTATFDAQSDTFTITDFTFNPNGDTASFVSVPTVPEPETWGMLALGLGLMAQVVRRRGAIVR